MYYQVFTEDMCLLAATHKKEEAHTFARMYSSGSSERPSSNLWVNESESEYDDSEAVSFYASGARFDKRK